MVGICSVGVIFLIVQLFEFRGVVANSGAYSLGDKRLVIDARKTLVELREKLALTTFALSSQTRTME